jgi:hypothetical protein
MQEVADPLNYKGNAQVENKQHVNYKKIQIALSGSMAAFGSAVVGYLTFGFVGGMSFVILVFGIMWFAQIQLETALDTIEIRVKQE